MDKSRDDRRQDSHAKWYSMVFLHLVRVFESEFVFLSAYNLAKSRRALCISEFDPTSPQKLLSSYVLCFIATSMQSTNREASLLCLLLVGFSTPPFYALSGSTGAICTAW